MQRWWKSHAAHIHSHHENEDDKFTPAMAERINLPEKLTTDHVVLTEHLDKIDGLVKALSTEQAGCVAALKDAWSECEFWCSILLDKLSHTHRHEDIPLPQDCVLTVRTDKLRYPRVCHRREDDEAPSA